MKPPASRSNPSVTIGTTGRWPFQSLVKLSGLELARHHYVVGTTGMGKSKFIAHCAASLIMQGVPCAVVDPHGDLAIDLLGILKARGFYASAEAFDRVWLCEFGRTDRYVPFNVLKQSDCDIYTIAKNVVDACKRAWPELGITFENLMSACAHVLSENGLPLTMAMTLLNKKEFRERLLQQVSDPVVVSYFHDEVDSWSKQAAEQLSGSTKRRLYELSYAPALRYSLGAQENILDFHRFLQEGVSVIYNLSGVTPDTRSLLGCLIAVGYEQATFARAKILEQDRHQYHLFYDEFQVMVDRSEGAFVTALSEARKHHITQWLAHQTLSQISERVQSALQNALPTVFGLGRSDALVSAQILGHYDPFRIKHLVDDAMQVERTHPQFFNVQEQFEVMAQEIEDLSVRTAFTKLVRKPLFGASKVETIKFKTLDIGPMASWGEIQELREIYAQKLLRSIGDIGGEALEQRNRASEQVCNTEAWLGRRGPV